MDSLYNPFIFGRALDPTEVLGRETELHRLFSRLHTGQSTAIIGQPHIGKTSLLHYAVDAVTRKSIFGSQFDRALFGLLDAHTLHGVNTQAGFWERALAPLDECLQKNRPEHLKPLNAIYALARENKFGTFVLERLFTELNAANSRLVLMLDEFDDFLSNPVLNSAEFYGGLRSLASRSAGLVLVIATRKDLEQLNKLTQKINPHGSPYFNVFTELKLGTLSKKALAELFDRAGDHFNRRDRKYIIEVSGGHPYLAQAAAATLWDAIEDGYKGTARYQAGSREFFRQTKPHFTDTWQSWTNATKKAVTAVSLAQIQRLLTGEKLEASELIDDLDDYSPELETLAANGVLAEDKKNEWIVIQKAFLWWLTDELRRNLRDDTDLKTWLQAQEMDNLVTRQEQQRMGGTAKKMLNAMGKGAWTLITAFAQGIAEGVGEGLVHK